jgi:hypothetical protein
VGTSLVPTITITYPPTLRPDGSKQTLTQLATLGALLLWLFSLSLAMLGLSSIVTFQKMAREAKETGKLRWAFRGGMCCALLVWLIFTLLGVSFGGFGM